VGYRFVCHLVGGRVRMITRNGLDWLSNFPAIVEVLTKLPAKSAIVDGEAVILDGMGASHFATCSKRLRAFDLLYVNGADLRRARSGSAMGHAGRCYGLAVQPRISRLEQNSTKFEWNICCATKPRVAQVCFPMMQRTRNPEIAPKSAERWRVGNSGEYVAVQVGDSTEASFLLPPLEAIALGRALVAEGQALLSQSVALKDAPVS
jgi:hypothetical protein